MWALCYGFAIKDNEHDGFPILVKLNDEIKVAILFKHHEPKAFY
jgi:hypothetical protein